MMAQDFASSRGLSGSGQTRLNVMHWEVESADVKRFTCYVLRFALAGFW